MRRLRLIPPTVWRLCFAAGWRHGHGTACALVLNAGCISCGSSLLLLLLLLLLPVCLLLWHLFLPALRLRMLLAWQLIPFRAVCRSLLLTRLCHIISKAGR